MREKPVTAFACFAGDGRYSGDELNRVMSPQGIARLMGAAILIFAIVIMAASGTYVVPPGYRGVRVTMGKVSPAFNPEGFGLKAPFTTTIHPVSIRQQTAEDKADCYSADLQQIH